MRIACHFTIPRPPVLELDAALQDAFRILRRWDGAINFLYPGVNKVRVHQVFCGFHQLSYLRSLERRVDLHHIFANGLYPFPILKFLKKPIVYSSVIQVNSISCFAHYCLNRVATFVVSSDVDQEQLRRESFPAKVILPAIDLDRFFCTPMPRVDPFVLLAGSAPWSKEQFETKGVDVLLAAAQRLPWLNIVFLWRGTLYEEMLARVRRMGLTSRVEVVQSQVDVNARLTDMHGAVVLVRHPELIKSYPHSLLESLAAGKPVLISSDLAMASYVENHGCGVGVPSIEIEQVIAGIELLRSKYQGYAAAARSLDMRPFGVDSMLEAYETLYHEVLAR
jgi:glycosyltransferase involved in cell wall biosynthesis